MTDGIRLGENSPSTFKLGNYQVTNIFLGEIEVWSEGSGPTTDETYLKQLPNFSQNLETLEFRKVGE